MSSLHRLMLAPLAALTLACESAEVVPLEPAAPTLHALADSYQLTEVAGYTLPAVVAVGNPSLGAQDLYTMADAGSLTLNSNGTYTLTAALSDFRDAGIGGEEVGAAEYVDTGVWQRSGNTLTLLSYDRVAEQHVGEILANGGLTLTQRFVDSYYQRPARYQAVQD